MRAFSAGACTLIVTCSLCEACSPCMSTEPYEVVSPPRDWTAHPAIVDLAAPSMLYAISDVHGGYDGLATLLANAGITTGVPASPSSIAWAAGDATLVVAGDLVDKGPNGLEVIDALIGLQTSASASGGHVVVTLGNHEAEFLADPTNCKADSGDGVDTELRTDKIDPSAIASGSDPRGVWLRELPFGARVGRWFFAHAANTKGRPIGALEMALEADVTANDYRGSEVIGADSILESRDWFTDDSAVTSTLSALAVDHVVFGHTPTALGTEGAIATAHGGALLRIDCGMSPDVGYSQGEVLRVRLTNGTEIIEAIASTGNARPL